VGLMLVLGAPRAALGQIDYRNLEDDRPTLIEDAYPIESRAFEFLLPARYSRDRNGGSVLSFTPEIEYGLLRNLQVGLKVPMAGVASDAPPDAGRDWGLSGLRLFTLYNFNTASRTLPALAVRIDATFPVGSLAGEGTRLTAKALATRTWGRSRLHLNGAYTFGEDQCLAAAEAAHKWWYGVAADRTLWRQSTLLVAELYALRSILSEPVQVNASIGIRRQLTPYTVVDLGVTRGLREGTGPDYEFTIGISRAFAIAGLMGVRR
jgi:hypothetical protein